MARGLEDNGPVSTHGVGESSRLLPANKPGAVPTKTKTKPATQKRKNSDGSLDFERVVNEYSIEAKRELLLGTSNNGARIYSKNTIRWILTIACALFSGFTTVVIVSVTEELVSWRTRTLANWLALSNHNNNNDNNNDHDNIDEGTYTFWFVFGAYCLVSLLLADAAAALCLYWPGVPEAVGSGIPEVKAYLNGIRVKKFDNLLFVVVKMVGSVLSVGSSMAVGMEGPLVMIGACAGATLAHCGTILSWLVLEIKAWKDHWKRNKGGRIRPTTTKTGKTSVYDQSIDPESEPILYWLWVKATSDLSYFANDAERRKLITVGAACGFAASFGAPIGGMLFIMDDISTFFDQGMFLRILVANSVGTFCLAYYRGNLSDYGAITFGSYTGDNDDSIGHRFVEIPFWVAMGIGGGVLGGWFCKAFGELKRKSGKQFQTKGMKLLRISYISLINSVVMFLLPTMPWVCHEETAAFAAAAAERQFFCEEGQVNQMATIFFGSRAKAIVRILSEPGQFFASTLAIVGAVFFLLMLVTNTTSIPSGLFTPIVVSGASFGAAFGVFLNQHVDENIDASSFALLGVGAMMAGIQRSTVSTCVILVEGTGQMKILLPAMIVVVISNYVAHMVYNDGVYEVLMKLKGYPYLCHAKDDCFDVITVRQIMASPPVTVREKERAVRLVEILRSTSHHGFPVVDKDGHFQGLVRRKQIIALMEFGVFEKVGPGDDAIERSISDSARSASDKLGNSNRGPMKYAYVAKDGLYNINYVEEMEEEEAKSPTSMWGLLRSAVKMKMVLTEDKKRRLADDITMPMVDVSGLVPSNFIEHEHEDEDAGIDGGGEDVVESDEEEEDDEQDDQPVELRVEDIASNADHSSESSESDRTMETIFSPSPHHQQGGSTLRGFARVGLNPRTNVVVISWLNPDCKDDVLDLAAVMNRGAYTVPENFPVSKAYNLFTLLGLRWIVVVGGADGGTVVGLLTRESFLELNLKEKTGKDATYFERV